MGISLNDALRLADKANKKPRSVGSMVIASGLGIDVMEFWRAPTRSVSNGIEWKFDGFRVRETIEGAVRFVVSIDSGGGKCSY